MRSIKKLRGWIDATYEDGFGPMGTNLDQLRRVADEIEREIADGYVRLPKDKDGRVIGIDDEVWYYDASADPNRYVVRAYSSSDFNSPDGRILDEIMLNDGKEGWRPSTWRYAGDLVCEKPDPLKDLLCEMIREHDSTTQFDEVIAKHYADRIRKLMGGGGE